MSRIWSVLRNAFGAVYYFAMMVTHLRDPDAHAARFINCTEGSSQARAFDRFAALDASHELLHSLPESLDLLEDRAKLARCPQGSLGRVYLDFVTANNLTVGYIMDLVEEFSRQRTEGPQRAWWRRRSAASHDLRHVLSGYDSSHMGEYCNLCFRFAQTGCWGVGLLAVFGVAVLLGEGSLNVIAAGLEAYRRGRGSTPIDLFPWEKHFDTPLAECRGMLGLSPPRQFLAQIAPDAYPMAGPSAGEDVQDLEPVLARA